MQSTHGSDLLGSAVVHWTRVCVDGAEEGRCSMEATCLCNAL